MPCWTERSQLAFAELADGLHRFLIGCKRGLFKIIKGSHQQFQSHEHGNEHEKLGQRGRLGQGRQHRSLEEVSAASETSLRARMVFGVALGALHEAVP